MGMSIHILHVLENLWICMWEGIDSRLNDLNGHVVILLFYLFRSEHHCPNFSREAEEPGNLIHIINQLSRAWKKTGKRKMQILQKNGH